MKHGIVSLLLLTAVGCGRTTTPECLDSQEDWCPLNSTTEPRAFHAAVWTGKEVLIWGGYGKDFQTFLNTGLRIDPKSGRIRPMTTHGAPEGRVDELAIWTGREMLIWGGRTPAKDFEDGTLYDPEADAWRPLNTDMGHQSAAAAWTGSELFVWGGTDELGMRSHSGFLLDPETGDTRSVNPEGGPDVPRPQIVALGSALVLCGGKFDNDATAVFDLMANEWRAINSDGIVPAEFGSAGFAFGDSAYFCGPHFECASYSPAEDAWTPFPVRGSTTGYGKAWALSSQRLVLFGGQTGNNVAVEEQGVYDFSAAEWSDLPAEGRPSPRWGSTLTNVADSSFLLWGGQREEFDLIEEGFILNLR